MRGNEPDEPQETLSSDVLLGSKLSLDELLNSLGLSRSGELAVTDLL